MKKVFVAGLTGGIASGKTLALSELARAGARVFSSDAIARELLRRGSPLARAAVKAFGPSIAAPDGSIDRRRLDQRAFKSPSERRRLEALLHPPVLRAMRREIARARGGALVCDVPLLFEKGLAARFDATILISSPRSSRISRLRRFRGLSRSEALSRMGAQWPDARKRPLADVVVENRGSKSQFLRTIRSYGRAMAVISKST